MHYEIASAHCLLCQHSQGLETSLSEKMSILQLLATAWVLNKLLLWHNRQEEEHLCSNYWVRNNNWKRFSLNDINRYFLSCISIIQNNNYVKVHGVGKKRSTTYWETFYIFFFLTRTIIHAFLWSAVFFLSVQIYKCIITNT